MSDAMERYCSNCAYYDRVVGRQKLSCEGCINYSMHKFPEEIIAMFESITFADKIKAALPKEEKFSLDKLIDDHWKYNEGLVKLCFPYGVDGWETDDILRLVEFAYKQSGKHFWKHCKEHYNINGESNE